MNSKEINEFCNKYCDEKGRILSKEITISLDRYKTRLNEHLLITGASGTGKLRCGVLPNILQCNSNMIIFDEQGILYEDSIDVLEKNGYEIKKINLLDPIDSEFYNLVENISKEDIFVFSKMVQKEVRKTSGYSGLFCENTEACMLCPLFNLINLNNLHDFDLKMVGITKKLRYEISSIIDLLQIYLPKNSNALSKLIDELQNTPSSDKLYEYKHSTATLLIQARSNPADVSEKAVINTIATMSYYFPKNAVNTPHSSTIDLNKILTSGTKTALFITFTSPVISGTDCLTVSFLLSKIINTLYYKNSEIQGPWDIYFSDIILSDASPMLSNFEEKMYLLGQSGHGLILSVNSLSNLEETISSDLYKTIIHQTDTKLFLGTGCYEDIMRFCKMCFADDIETYANQLSMMKNDTCIVKIRGQKAIYDKKVNISK